MKAKTKSKIKKDFFPEQHQAAGVCNEEATMYITEYCNPFA
jgi:hypothetical protein